MWLPGGARGSSSSCARSLPMFGSWKKRRLDARRQRPRHPRIAGSPERHAQAALDVGRRRLPGAAALLRSRCPGRPGAHRFGHRPWRPPGAAAVAGAYALGRSVTGLRSTTGLILAGVAIAAFFNSIQSYVQQTQTSSIRQVYSWILGRLVTAGWDDVILVLPYVVLSVAVIFLHRRLLDSLTLGEDEITSLGIPVRRVRLIVVVAATLGTAAVVAVGGTIAFVGIIVPHTIRLLVGRSYRVVIPLSVLFGAAFLVLADTAARTLVAPAELPIGVITAFLGAPFFIAVMRSTRGAPL